MFRYPTRAPWGMGNSLLGFAVSSGTVSLMFSVDVLRVELVHDGLTYSLVPL